MTLRERLRKDLQDAMRAQDARRKSALRMVLTSIQLVEAESPRTLDDKEVIELIRKEVKRREEAVELMREAGRDELVAEEMAELEILNEYLPALMSEAEIREMAQSVIEEVGAESMGDMGKVMGTMMPRVKGKADGKTVNQVVRQLLSA
ncbi:MAG: GatB/YqeY domain-containing protein [Anaerolineae bacterium]